MRLDTIVYDEKSNFPIQLKNKLTFKTVKNWTLTLVTIIHVKLLLNACIFEATTVARS